MNFIKTEYVKSEEIKRFRKKYGLTQKDLAELLGCSKPTVERWERNEKVDGIPAFLFDLLMRYPDIMNELVVPERYFPIRLWYMHGQHVCTLIDVDEINQRVRIKNYTDNLLDRAFGRIEKPSFKDYEEFLESRCFPKQRDKMKLILEDLNLPFYDPMLIVKKTQGRMAEDDFWIRVEE